MIVDRSTSGKKLAAWEAELVIEEGAQQAGEFREVTPSEREVAMARSR